MNKLLKYIEDKELAKAIETMKANEAKRKKKEEAVEQALPGFLEKFKDQLPVIKSGGVSCWLEVSNRDDRTGLFNIVFKYREKTTYCQYYHQLSWCPFRANEGTFGNWPSEKLLDFVADWYAGLQDIPAPPPQPAKLIVNDPGDPSVGIFGSSFSIDCPFSEDLDSASMQEFKNQILNCYGNWLDNPQAWFSFKNQLDPTDVF